MQIDYSKWVVKYDHVLIVCYWLPIKPFRFSFFNQQFIFYIQWKIFHLSIEHFNRWEKIFHRCRWCIAWTVLQKFGILIFHCCTFWWKCHRDRLVVQEKRHNESVYAWIIVIHRWIGNYREVKQRLSEIVWDNQIKYSICRIWGKFHMILTSLQFFPIANILFRAE